MTHELTFRFDRAFIRSGLRRDYLWRAALRMTLILLLGVVALLALRRIGQDSPWFFLLFAGLALVSAIRFAVGFRSTVEHTLQLWIKQSPQQTIRFEADADALTVELADNHTRYRWQDLKRLWRYDDVWLLEVVKNTSILFPPREAPEAMKQFIVECCRGAGVRV